MSKAPTKKAAPAKAAAEPAEAAPAKATKSASAKSADTKAATAKSAKAPKADAEKAAPSKVDAPKSGAKPNALQQPLKPSADLAAIVGSKPLPRGEVVSKVWEHIKKNNLQNPSNKREIVADDKLKKIFGKDSCSMFEMNKHLAAHLKS